MTGKSRVILSEDWTATLLGFILIGGVLILGYGSTPGYQWSNGLELTSKVFSQQNLVAIAIQGFTILLILLAAWRLTGKSLQASWKVFLVLFGVSQVALLMAGNAFVKSYNLEAVIFSLLFGLVLGHFLRIPDQWREYISAELFVKIGLVLMGTSIIFSDLLKAGSLGLVQSLIVVIAVWYVAYWISKKWKVDSELAMMLSSAVSICGVSAAIATAGAIKGDSKKLSFVISLVLVTAIPMMIGMPYIARYFGFSQEVTGAWLGGTIDTTGAVVAAGSLAGDTALKISTIVKFSQNVLLGLAALAISIYWAYTKDTKGNEPVSISILWQRFPKFVLGFMLASVLFSFVISPAKVGMVKDSLKGLQNAWFVLAFTCIGLETKFHDFFQRSNRKALYAFLLAQAFNILLTLLIAWILFN